MLIYLFAGYCKMKLSMPQVQGVSERTTDMSASIGEIVVAIEVLTSNCQRNFEKLAKRSTKGKSCHGSLLSPDLIGKKDSEHY
jgi:hypothetical protein